jgi:hypothetical protein
LFSQAAAPRSWDLKDWHDYLDRVGANPTWQDADQSRLRARCPAHVGDRNSLCLSSGGKRRVVAYCHACGSLGDYFNRLCVAASRGERMPEICRSRGQGGDVQPKGKRTAEWFYRTKKGYVFRRVRYDDPVSGGKTYRWERRVGGPDPDRERWIPGLGRWSVRELPFYGQDRLPSDPEAVIYLVEGEKSVDAARRAGLVAISSPTSANQWLPDMRFLGGRKIVIIADRDEAGYRYAARCREMLVTLGSDVTVARTPVDKKAADLVDHLEAGLGVEDLELSPWQGSEDETLPKGLGTTRPSAGKKEQTAQWLINSLESRGGGDYSAKIVKEGLEAGFTDRYIRQVRVDLGIVSTRVAQPWGAVTYWHFPEDHPYWSNAEGGGEVQPPFGIPPTNVHTSSTPTPPSAQSPATCTDTRQHRLGEPVFGVLTERDLSDAIYLAGEATGVWLPTCCPDGAEHRRAQFDAFARLTALFSRPYEPHRRRPRHRGH